MVLQGLNMRTDRNTLETCTACTDLRELPTVTRDRQEAFLESENGQANLSSATVCLWALTYQQVGMEIGPLRERRE